jgi:hypothetical protein
MAIKQKALTLIAVVEPTKIQSLRRVLASIQAAIDSGAPTNQALFPSLPSVHFARCAILELPVELGDSSLPTSLLLATNYDGRETDHLRELIDIGGPVLHCIFSHCVGYPTQAGANHRNAVSQFISDHKCSYGAFYVGAVGRSVEEIRREDDLHKLLCEELEALAWESKDAGRDATTARDVRMALQKIVMADSKLGWARHPVELPIKGRLAKTIKWGTIVSIPVLAWFLIGTTIGWLLAIVPLLGLPAFALTLRRRERTDPFDLRVVNSDRVRARAEKLEQSEARRIQNDMTVVTDIKPGLFRLAVLRSVLLFANFRARFIFYKGSLQGITTIHFARWVVIDRGERMIFLANYDGRWDHYLDEFIEQASEPINAIWSNTVGYPLTNMLIARGAQSRGYFKAFVRSHQLATEVWYSAYEDLTMKQIKRNGRVRDELFADLGEGEISAWMRLLD